MSAPKPEDVPEDVLITATGAYLDNEWRTSEAAMRAAIAAVWPRIAAAEREACALVADEMAESYSAAWRAGLKGSNHLEGKSDGADEIAAAIRARGEA